MITTASRRQRGMTLIEIMIVVAIVGIASGGVVLSFRAVNKAHVRGNATKMGAAIRYLYDRAIVTGKYYRLTIDLDQALYYAEVSDDRFYLNAEKENGPGRGRAFDVDAQTKLQDEEEKRLVANSAGLAAQLQPPPMPKRAHFQSFNDAMLPRITMRDSFVRDIYTPRQREAYSRGKAYLYFFPDGHSERAVIHIQGGRVPPEDVDPPAVEYSDVYSLVLHPLTGRVEVKTGYIDLPRDFDTVDDEGQTEGAH